MKTHLDMRIEAAREAIYRRQRSLVGKITKSSMRDALAAAGRPTAAESFFAEPPSGMDIARYFLEETSRTHRADGIELWREGAEYCYLWKYVEVDHDLRVSYLLDVRTSRADTPGEFKETRDLLFVHAGAGLRVPEVEWWNRPIRFDADREAHLDWHHDGLRWFLDRDEAAMESV